MPEKAGRRSQVSKSNASSVVSFSERKQARDATTKSLERRVAEAHADLVKLELEATSEEFLQQLGETVSLVRRLRKQKGLSCILWFDNCSLDLG
jgi:hypothetical protein